MAALYKGKLINDVSDRKTLMTDIVSAGFKGAVIALTILVGIISIAIGAKFAPWLTIIVCVAGIGASLGVAFRKC